MANSTVYPYGTGGSLPSSIGIINDLVTGGVDKALSAEQGVVLNMKGGYKGRASLADFTLNEGYLQGVKGDTISSPTSGSTMYYSNPFAVVTGELVVVKTAGSNIATICTTDANGSSYKAVAGGTYPGQTEVIRTYAYLVSENGYIAISGRKANLDCLVGTSVSPIIIARSKDEGGDDGVISNLAMNRLIYGDDDSVATKTKGYVDKDGDIQSANSTYIYTIANDGYKYVKANVGNGTASQSYAISFFSGVPSSSTLLAVNSVRFSEFESGGKHTFKAAVPEGCVNIIVTSLNTYYESISLFKSDSLITVGNINDYASSEGGGSDNDVDRAISQFAKQNNASSAVNPQNSSFRALFFSDIHADTSAMTAIVDKANSLNAKGYVDAVLNAGDTAEGAVTESYSWFNNAIDNCDVDVLTAIGNHDFTSSNSEAAYTKIIAPMITKVSDIVQPEGAAQNYLHYYYKDYGIVRLIGLNTMADDQAQVTWLSMVLADAVTNTKHVVILNHYPFSNDVAPVVFPTPTAFFEASTNTFMSSAGSVQNIWTGNEAMGGLPPIPTAYLAAVKTFEDNGGHFVCWLTGHIHYDHFYDVTDHETYGYQPMFNTACARRGMGARDFIKNVSAAGGPDCYNYFAVDTTQQMFKIVRIGCNLDVLGRSRKVLTYHYGAHKIVSNF